MKKWSMLMAIPTLFGLEGLVADELKYRGFQGVEAENGRVLFEGDWKDLADANIWTRCGERVLIVLARFQAHSFEELFQGTKEAPWENFIGSMDHFPVKGWSLDSQLHSVPDCQKIIKKAVVEHLKECYGNPWFEETGPLMQIQFSIHKDQVTLMLDTSGAGLHKRGYRADANEAPIRETLAAGIVDLSRVRSDSLVCDPMCGSGTILIEAAMKARNLAPGIERRFQVEKWGCFPGKIMLEQREAALAQVRKDANFEGIGFDIDPHAVELTLANAKKAHVGKMITASVQDIARFHAEKLPMEGHRKALILCNPPYGERLLDTQKARELYRTMGVVFKPLPDHAYSVITPDEEFESVFERKADKQRKLYNGMLKCRLYMYFR
ncbi:MAG: class I SAM-dependent RNA methyltransferase [Lachnospiraceae bacterium]|mgnify:CR=1 FL=1|nr:class I SAM-dependent RNA methyltransferase [Lachnospiraceae bacterium]